jgi:hypothetical protein
MARSPGPGATLFSPARPSPSPRATLLPRLGEARVTPQPARWLRPHPGARPPLSPPCADQPWRPRGARGTTPTRSPRHGLGPGPCPVRCARGHAAHAPGSAGARPLPQHARSRPWHPVWRVRCPGVALPARGAPGAARRARAARPWHLARCARFRPDVAPLPARGAQRGVRAAQPRCGSFTARQCGLARASAHVVRTASWRGSPCSRRDASLPATLVAYPSTP